MSRRFFYSFFPTVANLISETPILSSIHDQVIFPEEVAFLCPEVILGGVFRNPSLLLCALLGFYVGCLGGTQCGDILWKVAFYSFAAMNAVCFFLHSLLTVNEGVTLPESLPILWILDNFFTGTSSMAILFAHGRLLLPANANVERYYWVSSGVLAAMAVGSFVANGCTLPLELWYIVPTATAAPVVWLNLLREYWYFGCHGRRLLGCAVASLVILCGVVLDAPLCRLVGATSSDIVRAPTLVFLGCDIAFWSLLPGELTTATVAAKFPVSS